MANRRLSILALASAMCAAAVSEVAAGFAAFPTLWQLTAMALSGASALVTGTLSGAVPGGASKNLQPGAQVADQAGRSSAASTHLSCGSLRYWLDPAELSGASRYPGTKRVPTAARVTQTEPGRKVGVPVDHLATVSGVLTAGHHYPQTIGKPTRDRRLKTIEKHRHLPS